MCFQIEREGCMEIEKVYAKREEIDGGLTFKEIEENKEYHNVVWYDKWGMPFKYENGVLYYCDKVGVFKRHKWERVYMAGVDLPYKKFFTAMEYAGLLATARDIV